MIDITGKRVWFFLISGIAIVLSIVFLVVFGLKPGIEFNSGSMLTVSFEQPVDYDEFQQEVVKLGYTNVIIQHTGADDFLIRTQELTEAEKTQLEADLVARFGTLSEAQFYSVSPLVAAETARNTAIAVIIAAVGILLYIVWAFRKLPKAFYCGTSAIIALLHDVLITAGVFSLLGVLLGWEINLMFITGVLAVIGYSVNNIVVVFDRIRENLKKGISPSFEVVTNHSVVETLSRCLNTSVTTLITILALLLFVGGSIHNFVWVLLIGVVVGTFDAICIAPALLVVFETGKWSKSKQPAQALK